MISGYQWDKDKDRANIEKHGMSLNEGRAIFADENAQLAEDTRRDYGERRFILTGLIRGRLHVVVFVRRENSVRLISVRKANRREQRQYALDSI